MSDHYLDRLRQDWDCRAERLADEQTLMDAVVRTFPCLIVLEAAIALGIGDALDLERPRLAVALADRLDADPDRLEAVLRLLVGMELVAEEPTGYRLRPRGAVVLPSAAPRELVSPYLDFYRLARPLLPEFVSILRGSRDGVAMGWPPRDREESTAFETFMTATAPYIAAFLDEQADLGDRRMLLDIGGGDGTVACLLCQKHGHLTASVLNLPHVRPLVEGTAARYGVGDRVRFVPCDFRVQPLPSTGFDVVLFARTLCDWGDDLVAGLLGQCRGVLTHNGIVWICETLAEPGRTWDGDPWFTFWKTLVPGYWQHGPRTAEAWSDLARHAGLTLADRAINRRQPLPGLTLQTLCRAEPFCPSTPHVRQDSGGRRRSARPWLLEIAPPSPVQTPRPVPAKVCARLHANELAEPWPDEVLAAIAEAARREPLHRYPDPGGCALRSVIGRAYEVPLDQVVLDAGSLGIILLLARTLTASADYRARRVLVPEPTFPAYSQIARSVGLEVVEVPLTEDFQLDDEAMRAELDRGAGVCFLACPNNPSGTLWRRSTLRALIVAYPTTIFTIDEVYLAYAGVPSLWDRDAPENLVCLSSLSKVGLASERIGYAIAHAPIARRLRADQLPFRLPRLAMVVGELVLTRFRDVQRDLVARVIANRARLATILGRLPGAGVFPSAANMILARLASPEQAQALVTRLERQGILIHGFPPSDRLADCVRVTVGTGAELDLLESALDTWSPENET